MYLVLDRQTGADPAYDYGKHFLFQGHETGTVGYVTRINLDADGPHRVTLLGTRDVAATPLPVFDGITWDPWAKRLLVTAESGSPTGGVWQATLDIPSPIENLEPLGSGGVRGDPERRRGQPLPARGRRRRDGTAGRRRRSSRTASSTGSCRRTRPI